MLNIHRLAGLAGSRNAALYAVHAMQLYRVQGFNSTHARTVHWLGHLKVLWVQFVRLRPLLINLWTLLTECLGNGSALVSGGEISDGSSDVSLGGCSLH